MTADMVAAVLRFFSEVSSDVMMKDWLGGADGNIFWPVLLTMLCNTPLHTPVSLNVFPHKFEVIYPMFNPFGAIHENCCLLSLLLTYFGGLYCKQYGPRSDCSLGSSLIRVHSVFSL